MREREPLTPPDGPETAAERARRRRRLAEVFGEVLPEQTGDDRGGRGDDERADAADERLRRDVPPHHGPVG
ncbi:hypothetical protein ASG49_03630 [Marmoricola sp. Leaf446]|uniref:hypothetical protein n=1 Tax=Marmoricola sp. Leaf446 TaxID=1736379 RepID=UPI000700F8A2|nr:hypothetical protein [Marmoricola sp. Leaf446]KQT94030.1 hypothetical protein ASG49_03630 [Marmoricola sp. Leaf446]